MESQMDAAKEVGLMAAVVGMAALLVTGCETTEPETKVVVPSAATSAPEYEGDGDVPEQRYVIRMSDGERDWEVQFPDVATGYEMHIPLDDRKSQTGSDSVQWQSENMTEADKELLEQMRRDNDEMEREGVYVNGENVNDSGNDQQSQNGRQTNQDGDSSQSSDGRSRRPGVESGNDGETDDGQSQGDESSDDSSSDESKKAPYRQSYLLGIEEVRKLHKAGKYELAMVKLKKLEEAYPNDVKILSMKGTLWLKLGRESLARKAWERVLQIDQGNEQVKEALKRLNGSE